LSLLSLGIDGLIEDCATHSSFSTFALGAHLLWRGLLCPSRPALLACPCLPALPACVATVRPWRFHHHHRHRHHHRHITIITIIIIVVAQLLLWLDLGLALGFGPFDYSRGLRVVRPMVYIWRFEPFRNSLFHFLQTVAGAFVLLFLLLLLLLLPPPLLPLLLLPRVRPHCC
jgi:hypothetical protein